MLISVITKSKLSMLSVFCKTMMRPVNLMVLVLCKLHNLPVKYVIPSEW